MLGGSVIKVVSCCKINYFGQFSTILEDFDWTNTVGEVKGSFFSWSFLPWWPKSTKSHDLVFENSITGATGAKKIFVHVNLPKPISFWSNRISFKEWGLFLTMPPPKKYFWALRRAVCQELHRLEPQSWSRWPSPSIHRERSRCRCTPLTSLPCSSGSPICLQLPCMPSGHIRWISEHFAVPL